MLHLVARGLSYAEIGDQLYISPRTVARHLPSIYGKLGAIRGRRWRPSPSSRGWPEGDGVMG
jgi:ATP/maltotriose-dependent transcriptional regulator MalT